MSIPRIIHQVWLGDVMPTREREFCAGVRDRHPEWSYILWDEGNIGVFGRRWLNEIKQLRSLASRSNLIRLLALELIGGIYLDCDCECLKPMDTLLPQAPEAFAAFQDAGRICNAVMGARHGSVWVQWQLDHWHDFDQQDPASGVYLASKAPTDGLTILPTEWLYPWTYDAEPAMWVSHPDSYVAHHWEGSWRKKTHEVSK